MTPDEQLMQWVKDRDRVEHKRNLSRTSSAGDEGILPFLKVAGAFIGVVGAGILFAGNGSDRRTDIPSRPYTREPSPAENLAVIDSRSTTPSPILVAKFRSLLRHLSSVFPDDENRIANMAVKAQEIMLNRGESESLLSILTYADTVSADASKLGISCADTLALYISVRAPSR